MNKAQCARVVFVMPRCRHDHVRAVHKQARSLHEAGHDVILVVKSSPVQHYLGMRVVPARAPFGSLLRPLLNLPALYCQVRRLDADVYIVRNPDTIPLALFLRLTGHNVIYDTHEDFSKRPLIHPWLPGWSRPLFARLITGFEKLLARVSGAVIVTQLQQVEGLGGRVVLQPNAPLLSGPIVQPVYESGLENVARKLSFVYVGEITRYRGIFSMLDMIYAVNSETDAQLDIVGWVTSPELLAQMEKHPGWRYVVFHGSLSHSETLQRIKESDIGLALLKPVADYPTTSVTKLFEYMQFGKPFLASNFNAWRVSTARGPAGLYVNPDAACDIAASAVRLARDATLRRKLGEAGRHFVESGFNWEQVSKPFVDLVARYACAGKPRLKTRGRDAA